MPGLIAQLKGIPTTKRYNHATLFSDNYKRFTYIQLQQSNSSEETLQAKKDFELMAERLGVKFATTTLATVILGTIYLFNIPKQWDKDLATVVVMPISRAT
jgi:hypothetical protein